MRIGSTLLNSQKLKSQAHINAVIMHQNLHLANSRVRLGLKLQKERCGWVEPLSSLYPSSLSLFLPFQSVFPEVSHLFPHSLLTDTTLNCIDLMHTLSHKHRQTLTTKQLINIWFKTIQIFWRWLHGRTKMDIILECE
jgi:hypothetical protein